MTTLLPRTQCWILAVVLSTALVPGVGADDKPRKDPAKTSEDSTAKGAAKPEAAKEVLSTTRHAITLNGSKLEYEATAGTLPLKDDEGKLKANVFFVAYTRIDPEQVGKRPVTFAFNGGPGSSAVWLHLGTFGPRRVVLTPDDKSVAPPYQLVDNEQTLLDVTDLVFIDPVSTGYSRAASGQEAKQFHGVEGDIRSVGDFIQQYVTRFQRWDAPKFLAGESYGTTRAAGLSGYLQDHHGMNLNGIILLSAVINSQTLSFSEGNDLAYILFLPTYTATAWYHKKLAAELQADRPRALAEAEKFAQGEYAQALLKGDTMPSDERQAVAHKLARYTSLSEDYVLRSNLRVSSGRFEKELLRVERRTVGRYDSRFLGADLDAVGENPEYDPSYVAVQGPFTALLNNYMRQDLKYETDLTYRVLTDAVRPWDYGKAQNRYLNESPTLRQAMTKNRELRVFVACGYYDLATPYFAAHYTFHHLGLEPQLVDHVMMEYYGAGHMMYIDMPSLHKLKKDLNRFFDQARKKGHT